MSKQHRDFVILVKGKDEINALVVFSHTVTTPATQTEPAVDTEYLTVIYTNSVDGAAWPSKDKILQNLQVEMSVPPVGAGKFFGWKDVVSVETAIPPTTTPTPVPDDPLQKSSGIDGDAGDWTQTAGEGKTDDTSPVEQVSESSKSTTALVGPDGKTDAERGYGWGSPEHMASLREDPAPADPPAESPAA